MFAKLEDFLMNHVLGKLAVSAGVSVAAYLASGRMGASVSVDPNQVAALFLAGAHFSLDLIQHWRQPAAAAAAADVRAQLP